MKGAGIAQQDADWKGCTVMMHLDSNEPVADTLLLCQMQLDATPHSPEP